MSLKKLSAAHISRTCTRCVMDTTDPEIQFNENGICNHCTAAFARMKSQLLPLQEREIALRDLVAKVKREGEKKDFDCIIGVSGGVDSTSTAFYVKEMGLRPLAVHFDNGWDSELAVDNIKRTLDALKIELYTHVVDWEEFRDLQLCFLRASLANCEGPTDHGISSLLFRTANRFGIRHILTGSNLATEAIMPSAWGHYNQDLRLLKALHKRFGRIPLNSMPTISIPKYLYYVLVKGIRFVPFLNYVDYNKQKMKSVLSDEIGWRDYGGKHYESVWTRFFQGYYLPTKFGFDKRKAHYSSLICAGQMTRDEAIKELEKPIYDEDLLRQDFEYVLKKFGLTDNQFREILNLPTKLAQDYPSHFFLFHRLQRYKNVFRAIATRP